MNRVVSVLLVLGVWGVCRVADAQKLPPAGKTVLRTPISADDLNRKYVVIGPLGIPLGEVVTVDGVAVINQGKGAIYLFQVTAVNGKSLKSPVTMPYRIWPFGNLRDSKKLNTHSRYRLRVFQDGGFSGVPAQVMRETVSVQTHSYCFVTSLVVVRTADAPAPEGKDR